MSKLPSIPDIPEQEQTPAVKMLRVLVEQLLVRVQQQDEEIALLKDEINILKGQKRRPTFKGGNMDKKTEPKRSSSSDKPKQRAGSNKAKKTPRLSIDLNRVIEPAKSVPEGSRFKGYRDFVVQDLLIKVHTTRYRLAHWVTPDNKSSKASYRHPWQGDIMGLVWSVIFGNYILGIGTGKTLPVMGITGTA